MKKPVTFFYQYIKGKLLTYHIRKDGSVYYETRLKEYSHRPILNEAETSKRIKEYLLSDKPFMVCRFGANELATVKIFDFEVTGKYEGQLHRAHTNAGIFPETEEIGKRFAQLMIESIPSADLIGVWPQEFEEYYLGLYGSNNLECTWLNNLEPWMCPNDPWSAALESKKVLVVHPFTDSIQQQYSRREQIFPGTNILPEFELQTLKSIQTSGGESDERFKDWFEAYAWMKEEILKRDFDVAILGCGAYGFPLASEIKKAGKQAIHLGGGTQLLFGITGARWDKNPTVQKLINDAWVRPMDSEKPKNAKAVENACYW